MVKNSLKNFVFPFAICLLIALALYPDSKLDPSQYTTEGLNLDYNISEELAMNIKPETKKENLFTPYLGKSFQGFKEAIAFKESRGDYQIVNTLGYLGKYQFGSSTLKLLGVNNTTTQFLNNPKLQEKAFDANASRNKWVLRKDISRFDGKVIGGVKVTESGILAAAHLAGPGNVKKFLRSSGSANFSDAYGATVKYYMKSFSGYDTSSIIPDRRAKVRL